MEKPCVNSKTTFNLNQTSVNNLLILKPEFLFILGIDQLKQHINKNLESGIDINNIKVNDEPIILTAINNRNFLLFNFLLSKHINIDIYVNNTHIFKLILDKIDKEDLSTNFIESLINFKININASYKMCSCVNTNCDYINISLIDYIVRNKQCNVIDILNKHNLLTENHFIMSINTFSIEFVDYIYNTVHTLLTEKSLMYINNIPGEYNDYKMKYVMKINDNELKRLRLIQDTDTSCDVCLQNPKLNMELINNIYKRNCDCCRVLSHDCDHDKNLCLFCYNMLKYKPCSFCRKPSNINNGCPEITNTEIRPPPNHNPTVNDMIFSAYIRIL